MRRFLAFAVIAVGLSSLPLHAQTPAFGPETFESGQLRTLPEGWTLDDASRSAGYTAALSDDRPRITKDRPGDGGRRSLMLLRESPDAEVRRFTGRVSRQIDAAQLASKRVTVSGFARVMAATGGQAAIAISAGSDPSRPAVYRQAEIGSMTWSEFRVAIDVPAISDPAPTLTVELILTGAGAVWIDDLAVTVNGDAGAGDEPASALDPRRLANLEAFTRVYGLIRHFHPSNEAAAADWDAMAIDGVRFIEPANTSQELADRLTAWFAPVAPLARFGVGDTPPADELPLKDAAARATHVVAWEHAGFAPANTPAQSPRATGPYRSIRTRAHVGSQLAQSLPPLDSPASAALPGGVWCRVPVSIYMINQETMPPAAAAQPTLTPRPAGWQPSPTDRATRLGAVVIAWNVLNHFYPYFDRVNTDWPAALRTALNEAATAETDDEQRDVLARLVAQLHDGHGRVGYASARPRAVLPLAWTWVDDQLVITARSERLTGDAARIQPGDTVLAIDGVPTADAYARVRPLVSAATEQYARFIAAEQLLAAAGAGAATLALRSVHGEQFDVRLERVPMHERVAEQRPPAITELSPRLWYIDLDRVTDEQFNAAVEQIAAGTGVIFDLRGYPRTSARPLQHLIDAAVNSPRWGVPVSTMPGGQARRWEVSNWQLGPWRPRFTAKAAFITDGRAISYAETLLGIVEHYRLAAIVGSPTAGTNGNIITFAVPGGFTITFTGMRVTKHDDSPHHGVGVQPTIPVSRTIEGIAAGRDEALEAAVNAVRAE